MYKVRSDEPQHEFLWDKETKSHNRYGKSIDTVADNTDLREESLQINGEEAVGDNPNRYKQHGFFFTADNCIGCHACEAACSEKNDNPAHIAFRSVGFVEGGSFPDYQRINISMACNHCDDPVCLKGCPTRAYTKFAEYGAVLQDPDICFGCGYCTWVCPYNAPQLDPVKGQVSKCNMCVDRLEVGLKPACAAACLGNALDFGVIENIPEHRTQAKTEIPGFPRTDITNPNIRFQQTKTTHRVMSRVDSMPLKYQRDDAEGKFEPVVDKKHGETKSWGWSKLLHSHENAHVIFTLSVQAVMGMFLWLVIAPLVESFTAGSAISSIHSSIAQLPLMLVMLLMMAFGLYKLNMHLGKPHRFYRGFNNLRHSPVSREIAGVSLFFASLVGYALFAVVDIPYGDLVSQLFAVTGMIGFLAGSWYMYRLYRIPARPFWDHWQTATGFYGTMLSLGGTLLLLVTALSGGATSQFITLVAIGIAAGLMLEGIGLYAHSKYLAATSNEGAAAHYTQTTEFGYSYLLRNLLLGLNLLIAVAIAATGSLPLFSLIGLVTLVVMAYTGRILFYALVIPTTMPGAFFWKNKGFVEHARESELADMQQLGVAYERHHKFRLDELVQTIRETSIKDMGAHVARVVTGR
ncbi:aspartate carbamoyltransferase [Solemya velum gill symbiont]|uniref:Aspartate carbamoyltransferase n=2 Tax=Solemya velum gill symbiont TaxID=2340 RepID=A0A1T2DSP2_SOVGS|nr:DmsC/YnfH family molybdoenzyme membrane anchor subunit [Solemya velum gill symbiont]OOY34193.1 aspartate carbamoyltransferase [Solemya velum gill symbiont]OOY36891.1 aspartate carbamoyltransferase [Solemya velum gill symbiont]OOY40053.1 aspartate carbamoyltransferase [Solemya velum gill symbiont]OOY44405.1 aspartate carbamoyltransferase [Solemya velum gill symbiont]OOY46485.1 aspartate carbamoyltransferase [Solemya velum gill symbiont]